MSQYLILFAVTLVLGFALCEYKPSRKKDMLFLVIAALIMCALAAVRSGSVGVDYDWVYKKYFLQVCENNDLAFIFSKANPYRSEFLYTLLNMAIASVTHEPLVMWGAVSCVIVLLRVVFVALYSKKPWLAVFCYISLGFYGYSLCTLRQELGISVAMFALPFLQKRKPIPYFIIMLAAGLFHNSLFILLPLYFITLLPPTNKWVITLYGTCLLSVIFFSEKMLALFTSTFKRFSFYAPGSYYLKGRNINTVFMWIVLLLIISLCYKRLIARDPKNLYLYNLYLFGTIIMTLTVKHFVFQRVALMLLPFSIMLIPETVLAFSPTMALTDGANDKALPAARRAQLKKELMDSRRMYFSIMGLFIFVCALEYLFLLYANRLLLVPYKPFWM